MTRFKGLGSFILGLILIIVGFLTLVSKGTFEQYTGIDTTGYNPLVAFGFILIILGIISMYFFVREDKKKKSPYNVSPETEKVANSFVILSLSFLILLLILWFTTKDSIWTGIIAFSISSILVIGYCIYSNFKMKKRS